MKFCMIDAFAAHSFEGNPAAVVAVDKELSDRQMQQIALEFNQAETAFVQKRADGRIDLRWFTPKREVALCGHATLAAAHAIYREWFWVKTDDPVRFATRQSGELVCRELRLNLIEMDFPATPPTPCPLPENAAALLGIDCPIECCGTTAMNLTLMLPSHQQVRDARPDLRTLATWHPVGVTITAPTGGDGSGQFVSRFFAPAVGVDEDPVTGSAHCTLAVIYARRWGKNELTGHQLSQRRGSVFIRLVGERVFLRGEAELTMRGTIDDRVLA